MTLSSAVERAGGEADSLVERLAGATVDQLGLRVFRQSGFLQVATNVLFLDAVEHRSRKLQTQELSSPA